MEESCTADILSKEEYSKLCSEVGSLEEVGVCTCSDLVGDGGGGRCWEGVGIARVPLYICSFLSRMVCLCYVAIRSHPSPHLTQVGNGISHHTSYFLEQYLCKEGTR